MICRDTPTHGWVHGWFDGWVVQWVNGWGQIITKYWINLDVIEIIQFCLKIYDLWRHPHPWVHGWVNGWADVKSLKSNKSWPNQDNWITVYRHFWHFLEILLKPPQPLMGLFFTYLSLARVWGSVLGVRKSHFAPLGMVGGCWGVFYKLSLIRWRFGREGGL